MVREKALCDMIYENVNIRHCYVMEQLWRDKGAYFSTKGRPRRINGFLYLRGCDCTYRLPDGKEISARRGEVVFLPPFLEYEAYFHHFRDAQKDTVLINLLFSDEDGEVFWLPNELRVFQTADTDLIRLYFFNALQKSRSPIPNYAEIKAIIYQILSYLGTEDKSSSLQYSRYKDISKGILYLENDVAQTLTIEEVAAMCHISAGYFRKRFKEYCGVSPTQFRIRKKIELAKGLLKDGSLRVCEISDALGFENATYFCRLFKRYEGVTPLTFRQKNTRSS